METAATPELVKALPGMAANILIGRPLFYPPNIYIDIIPTHPGQPHTQYM